MAKTYTAIVERCPETNLYVGHVPGFRCAHSQGATLDELNANLREVIDLLTEEGHAQLEFESVNAQLIADD